MNTSLTACRHELTACGVCTPRDQLVDAINAWQPEGTWTVADRDTPRYRGPDVHTPSLAAAVAILPGFQVADIYDPDGKLVAQYHLFTGLDYDVDPTPAVRT